MGSAGRKPLLDPVTAEVDLRRLREMLRFGPRISIRAMAREFGFQSHGSLYNAATRYEASKGLKPDQKEDAPPAPTG